MTILEIDNIEDLYRQIKNKTAILENLEGQLDITGVNVQNKR